MCSQIEFRPKRWPIFFSNQKWDRSKKWFDWLKIDRLNNQNEMANLIWVTGDCTERRYKWDFFIFINIFWGLKGNWNDRSETNFLNDWIKYGLTKNASVNVNNGRTLTKWTSNIHNRPTKRANGADYKCNARMHEWVEKKRNNTKERTNFMHRFEIKMILHNAYVLGCRHKFSFSTPFGVFSLFWRHKDNTNTFIFSSVCPCHWYFVVHFHLGRFLLSLNLIHSFACVRQYFWCST